MWKADRAGDGMAEGCKPWGCSAWAMERFEIVAGWLRCMQPQRKLK